MSPQYRTSGAQLGKAMSPGSVLRYAAHSTRGYPQPSPLRGYISVGETSGRDYQQPSHHKGYVSTKETTYRGYQKPSYRKKYLSAKENPGCDYQKPSPRRGGLSVTCCRGLWRMIILVVAALTSLASFAAGGAFESLSRKDFKRCWTVESESPDYRITHIGDTVEILAPKGLTLWNNERLEGDLTIEFDACVMDEDQPGDRLSDLNCFWMASDPLHPDNLMKRKSWRSGIFNRCYSLQMYYLGYGGNHNSTTRFRRYDGNPLAVDSASLRPAILTEYTDPDHLLKPNKWYHVAISNRGNRVTYTIDGERIVDFRDPHPYTSGWFGFRTTLSRTRFANFKVTRHTGNDFPVNVSWIGDTPESPAPNTWGVPFGRGKVQSGQTFTLTADGQPIADYDFRPLAYWPDGSVKWGAYSAVIPAGAESVTIEPSANPPTRSAEIKTEGNANVGYIIDTGTMKAYLGHSGGNALLDSITIDGVKVTGMADIVASIHTPTPTGYNIGCFTSQIDSIAIETPGQAHTVVRIDGRCTDGSRQWLPFTVRLYFYAGSDKIRAVHTMMYDGDADKDFISSLGIRMRVPMRHRPYNRHVAFATADGGVWEEAVQPLVGRRPLKLDGENVQPAQYDGQRIAEPEAFDEKGRSLIGHWAEWDGFRLSQLSPDSYTIRKRATSATPWIGTHSGQQGSGFCYLGDPDAGVAVSMHDFRQSYPSTLQVDGARSDEATLTVWLWSPEAEPMDLRHYDTVAHDLNASYEDVQEGMSTPYGIARTSELTILPIRNNGKSIFNGREHLASLAKDLSSTPQLCCSPEYLHAQRAFGIWSLPDSSTSLRADIEKRLEDYLDLYKHCVEEHKWYGFWNYGDFMHTYDPVRHTWLYDVGGYAWDNTELASNMWLWYYFLRTGREDAWKLAKAMSRHTGEVDVYHFGDNAGLGSRHNVSHWGCGAKEARISQAAWNRFYYYLTGDERTGDLMTEVRDAEQKLYTLDPMRLAQPRELYPCTAPARLRIGPDWLAYAGNWLTEWERTGNTTYRDKILAGMSSIAALPNGIFTGPKALGFDPATGVISYEGDPEMINTNHLLPIMGGFEIVNEMNEMLPEREWIDTWLRHAAEYRGKSQNKFLIPRLPAYAYYHTHDEAFKAQAWRELLGKGYPDHLPPMEMVEVTAPDAPAPLLEYPDVTTNGTATWCLDAIYMLEVCPE